jgi:hypothetical protein
MAGALGLSNGGAVASPVASTAMPAAGADNSLVSKAINRGRAEYSQYRYRRVYHRRPYYRGVRVYRPYRAVAVRRYYRPAYRVYRPYPRVVCRTRVRIVRTAYGAFVRRPVQVCRRRW